MSTDRPESDLSVPPQQPPPPPYSGAALPPQPYDGPAPSNTPLYPPSAPANAPAIPGYPGAGAGLEQSGAPQFSPPPPGLYGTESAYPATAPRKKAGKRGRTVLAVLVVMALALVATGAVIKFTGLRTGIKTLDHAIDAVDNAVGGSNTTALGTPKAQYLSDLPGGEIPIRLIDGRIDLPPRGDLEANNGEFSINGTGVTVDSTKPYILSQGAVVKPEGTRLVEVPLPPEAPQAELVDVNAGIAILDNNNPGDEHRFSLWDIEAGTIRPYSTPEYSYFLNIINSNLFVVTVYGNEGSNDITLVGQDSAGKKLWETTTTGCFATQKRRIEDIYLRAECGNAVNATSGAVLEGEGKVLRGGYPQGAIVADENTDEILIFDAEFKNEERFPVSPSALGGQPELFGSFEDSKKMVQKLAENREYRPQTEGDPHYVYLVKPGGGIEEKVDYAFGERGGPMDASTLQCWPIAYLENGKRILCHEAAKIFAVDWPQAGAFDNSVKEAAHVNYRWMVAGGYMGVNFFRYADGNILMVSGDRIYLMR